MDVSDTPPPATPDTLILRRTMRWLWLQKTLYQFTYRGLRRKRRALETQEAEALRMATFYRDRMRREMIKHSAALGQRREDDEQWKDGA